MMEYYVLKGMHRGVNRVDGELYRHLFVVLRRKVDDEMFFTDGSGNLGRGRVVQVNRGYALVDIFKIEHHVNNEPEISLAFPVLKGDRSEIILEKCTEIGVSRFFPVIFDRGVVRSVSKQRMDRWRRIVESATSQSQRVHLPVIERPLHLSDFLDLYDGAIFYGSPGSIHFNIPEVPHRLAIVIGPEGDFSDRERRLLEERGTPFSLGERKLRSETAAILSSFLFTYEVYKKKIKRKEVI